MIQGQRKHNFRAQKHHLSLPPPPLLPNWRFPLPSPPITSLSPEIPKELFEFRISNPASTSTSPIKQPSSPLAFDIDNNQNEDGVSTSDEVDLEEIEGSLILDSGSTDDDDEEEERDKTEELDHSLYMSSPTSRRSYSYSQRHYSTSSSSTGNVLGEDQDDTGERESLSDLRYGNKRNRFRRTSSVDSRVSVDSKETIKVKSWIRDSREGEITPRVGRGWKSVAA